MIRAVIGNSILRRAYSNAIYARSYDEAREIASRLANCIEDPLVPAIVCRVDDTEVVITWCRDRSEDYEELHREALKELEGVLNT